MNLPTNLTQETMYNIKLQAYVLIAYSLSCPLQLLIEIMCCHADSFSLTSF